MPLTPALGISSLKPGVCTSSTRPASPYKGQVIYETDTGKIMIYYGATTGWQQEWNKPWGIMGSVASVTTTQSSITTAVDLTSFTNGAVTYIANRRLKITCQLRITQSTAAAVPEVYITNSANTILNRASNSVASGSTITVDFNHVLTTTAGSQTYKARATTGAGSLGTTVSSTQPGLFFVEDIGGVGSAPSA